MGNQAAVLKYFSKYKKKTDTELCIQLKSGAEKIREYTQEVSSLDLDSALSCSKAMGYEGNAAGIYWQLVCKLIPEDLGFSGRVTKGAIDPINQCLNYMYGILYGEVWKAIIKVGLDPYFGIIHGSMKDDGSLVFDLIEEFRAPFVDRVVISMVGRGFKPENSESGLLKTSNKKKIIKNFRKRWEKK